MAGKRRILLALCSVQLVATLERQVFDFLGFMWAPILANFFDVLFIIFGFFGAFQCASGYVYSYASWNVVWLGWNAFVVCYYLNVGTLNRDSGLLALGTGSVSWWEVNGWGCKAHWEYVEGNAWNRPMRVEGCFMHYYHVEVLHAAVQCVLATIAFVLGFCFGSSLSKSDETSSQSGGKSDGTRSLYTVEFTRPPELRTVAESAAAAAKPMTPRRVKRRSVSSRHSTRRSSSRRSSSRRNGTARRPRDSGHANPDYRQSSQRSLDSYAPADDEPYNRPASVRSSYSNFHGARPISLHAEVSVFGNEAAQYVPHASSSPALSAAEATPQVPQKRSLLLQQQQQHAETASNSSVPYRIYGNQSTFLNNGPPAYHLHQMSHYPSPDSETVM